MGQLNIEAFKYALKQYLVNLIIALVVSILIYFTSESIFASVTIFFGFALYGLRFVYMEYLNERDNIIKRLEGSNSKN